MQWKHFKCQTQLPYLRDLVQLSFESSAVPATLQVPDNFLLNSLYLMEHRCLSAPMGSHQHEALCACCVSSTEKLNPAHTDPLWGSIVCAGRGGMCWVKSKLDSRKRRNKGTANKTLVDRKPAGVRAGPLRWWRGPSTRLCCVLSHACARGPRCAGR